MDNRWVKCDTGKKLMDALLQEFYAETHEYRTELDRTEPLKCHDTPCVSQVYYLKRVSEGRHFRLFEEPQTDWYPG